MVGTKAIAVFHALFDVVGLLGNFLVIVTILLEKRFRIMRYVLLASLAVSDFLCLILANTFRIASIAQKRWPYGETMCYLQPFFVRYFYFNTVLHLMAVSYERYSAIVKSPLTYDGASTKSKVMLLVVIWLVPIPVSIGPFIGWGEYVYNPEVFFCEQGWSVHNNSTARTVIMLAVLTFFVPFLVIVFLNWKVFKVADILRRNTVGVQEGRLANDHSQWHELTARRIRERKAAVDVSIIIAAFLLCYLPGWITGLCRQFVKNINVSPEVVQITTGIFFANSLCNPIIYSVRKREFRTWVKNLLRRIIGVCRSINETRDNEIGRNMPISAGFS